MHGSGTPVESLNSDKQDNELLATVSQLSNLAPYDGSTICRFSSKLHQRPVTCSAERLVLNIEDVPVSMPCCAKHLIVLVRRKRKETNVVPENKRKKPDAPSVEGSQEDEMNDDEYIRSFAQTLMTYYEQRLVTLTQPQVFIDAMTPNERVQYYDNVNMALNCHTAARVLVAQGYLVRHNPMFHDFFRVDTFVDTCQQERRRDLCPEAPEDMYPS